MKKLILLLAIALFPVHSAHADTPTPTSDSKIYRITLEDDQGNEVKLVGTITKIKRKIARLQQKATTLAAAVTLGDNCRVEACFKQVVDVSKGTTELVPLNEAEILQRELDTAREAARVQALVDSAGENFQVRADAVLAIPIKVAGSSMTIQGSLEEIASQVSRLRAEADSLKDQVDPCSIQICYKTIVDLHWGLAPATTTTIPLTPEDLAQRATDRNRQAAQAEAVAVAAEAGMAAGASPVYQVSVSSSNRSFGTSGTRDQLVEQVRQLQAQAEQAATNASNLANNPIVERHLIVDLHWGLRPPTETIVEREITGAERDARVAAANSEAANAQALADAAAAALAEIP
jgi:hypothetical protein